MACRFLNPVGDGFPVPIAGFPSRRCEKTGFFWENSRKSGNLYRISVKFFLNFMEGVEVLTGLCYNASEYR